MRIISYERLSEHVIKFTLADRGKTKDICVSRTVCSPLQTLKGDEAFHKQCGNKSSRYIELFRAAQTIFQGKSADLNFEIDDEFRDE